MIGVIGGVGFFEAEIFKGAEVEEIKTPYGIVQMLVLGKVTFIPRHGIQIKLPPHKINHLANIFAFKEKGITKIVGVNSVGSLKQEVSPPSILIPHDYICPWNMATYHDDKIVHIIPCLNEELRQSLLSFAQKVGLEVVEKGVYIQTLGPRLETKAEIHMLKSYGDVVGMTMANEATLAKELELGYASICSVDNYAHGIVDEPLTSEMIIKNARINGDRIRDFLLKIAEEFE
jgi:5'-methylthioadenosine phosphorylase